MLFDVGAWGGIDSMNFRKLDLNLLRVFDAIYNQGSTTQAAEKLGMSQPAVSNALSRLRRHLDDPLFERDGQGISPTPRAASVAPQIAAALRAIEETLTPIPVFDPTTQSRDFSILLPDAIEQRILHPLFNARDQYAGVTYTLLPLGNNEPTEVLLSKRAEIVFSVDPIRHEQLRSTLLFSELAYLVARADHPVLGGRDEITIEDFFDSEFVVLAASLRRLGNISREIDAQNRTRRITLVTKSMWSILMTVATSEMVGIVSHSMAQEMAPRLGLKVFKVPFKQPEDNWYMGWHRDDDENPAVRWLRDVIIANEAAYSDVYSSDQ
ncbi:MAG: LysR family transcriptional regulator [Hyphomicrobiales bacterium]